MVVLPRIGREDEKEQAEQQVFRFDVRGTELTGFITREEDHASGFFRIPFEHWPLPKLL